MFTGNRGCLVDDDRSLVRHHRGDLWITCLTHFRDHRHPLDEPHRWTPLFFLDEAVALAAGHRPCGYCRPDAYRSYRDAATAGLGAEAPLSATDLNRRLGSERLRRGRGLDRGGDRLLWRAPLEELPDGTTVVVDGAARLVRGERTFRFGFERWHDPRPRGEGSVEVLTPPTSVAALRHGYVPVLSPLPG
jgi:hypothetical protein